MSEPEPEILIRRDGPYLVRGGLPLIRTAIVETRFGEPIAWDETVRFDVPEEYEICRCGRSGTKPFCDSTHERESFDGTETADRGPSAARRDVFEGDEVVMSDDRSLCTGAGFCGDRFTNVWEMIDETEDPEVRERLKAMVRLCPSGRLEYSVPPETASEEPPLEPSVGLEPNGPMWVRGGVRVVSEDGTAWEVRNRVTLCRCGRSRNKPFCDGSHRAGLFSDPAMPS